ncbi:MAG: RluA family pseudouridine synthase [Clostridia bacterium]|nr:RluA family pseudouridine synthase [Clostridia bacterium]
MEDIKILYEDKSITVCVKPPLVLSQQDENGPADLVSLLSQQTNVEHKCVHRLDFGVGGTMVYARNENAASKLSVAIQNRSFKKEYLAVIYGIPQESDGIYKDLLFKDSKKNKSYVVDRVRKGVKEASLEYKVLDTKKTEKGALSLVWIKLHTGRTHQIRVQFASRKTPLYGDGKYGSRTNEKVTALWSYKTTFPHPITHKELSFKSLPDDSFPWNLFEL